MIIFTAVNEYTISCKDNYTSIGIGSNDQVVMLKLDTKEVRRMIRLLQASLAIDEPSNNMKKSILNE